MMSAVKNRRTVGFLLAVAVMLWGGIFWRLLRYAGAGRNERPELLSQPIENPFRENRLILGYRDPFVELKDCKQPGNLKVYLPVKVLKLEEVKAPSFLFYGKIRKGRKDFLLFKHSDGRVLLWEKGTIDGYAVRKIYDDSVVLCKKGRDYMLSIN